MRPRKAESLLWLQKAQAKHITQKEAAEHMGISERWVRQLLRKMKTRGDQVLVHGLRGRPSNNRIRDDLRAEIIRLLHSECAGLGPAAAAAYLGDKKGIRVSDETVRKWMIQEDLWRPVRSRRIPVSSWSPRRQRDGGLVPWYVAESAWLGEANPSVRYLIGMVGDATSRAVARFCEFDSAEDNVALLQQYLRQSGRPREFLMGRARMNGTGLDLISRGGAKPAAEVQRILRRLDIAWSSAKPPASGRVEHFFDAAAKGLVERLRKNDIVTVEAANAYLTRFWLPRWNARLAAVAEDPYRAVPESADEVFTVESSHRREPNLVMERAS